MFTLSAPVLQNVKENSQVLSIVLHSLMPFSQILGAPSQRSSRRRKKSQIFRVSLLGKQKSLISVSFLENIQSCGATVEDLFISYCLCSLQKLRELKNQSSRYGSIKWDQVISLSSTYSMYTYHYHIWSLVLERHNFSTVNIWRNMLVHSKLPAV